MSNPADFLPRRGRPGATLILEVERELGPEDILRLALNDGRRTRIAPPAIQRATARHHRIAQFVAQGRTSADIALIMGMSAQRIRDLRETDPTFKELVAAYQSSMADLATDSGVRIRAVMEDGLELAVNEIHERLDDPTQLAQIPLGELRATAAFLADRTVAPPRQAQPASVPPTQIPFNIGKELTPVVDATPPPKVIEHDDPEKEK